MIPWFEAEEIVERVSQKVGSDITQRRRLCVEIVGVEDWCIDYTYANPTLWLLAESGIWYRLAGPLCPGGYRGQPAVEYAGVFAPTSR